jgi:sugar phosphate isomerase/epimerase
MLAVSTSFISDRITDGEDLFNRIQDFPASHIELDYRLSAAIIHKFIGLQKKSNIRIVSVHNYFPVPDRGRGSGKQPPGSGDFFSLSHPDQEERHQAIKWATESIQWAHKFEAPVLVLHCGQIIMDHANDWIRTEFCIGNSMSDAMHAFVQKKMAEREAKKGKHLDSLLFSLDKLLKVAEKYSVSLGLENRSHYHELPGFEEFMLLFKEFEGGPLGYWHDTGHAHTNEILGIQKPFSFLKTFKNQLLGIHLHDATGLQDHLVPGTGDIAFGALNEYIDKHIIKVLELKPGTRAEDMKKGYDFLKKQEF